MPRHQSPFVDRLTTRLLQLCDATQLTPPTTSLAERVFRELVVPWSRVEAFAENPHSGWVSEISDDNTPIEFSVTLSPVGSEVRVLFEPQGDSPTLAAHREAALLMHEELAREHGADLSRFRRVQDLFIPDDMRGPFALWSAVVFANGKPPSFKAYFNPQALGAGNAVALVEEGLRRLGLRHAWRHLAATLARRGPHRDELKYFALDLSASEQARVKVYVRHHDATPEDLQIAATAAPDSNRGEAEDFARAMGGGARRFKDRATFTCAAFVGGDDDRPSATTQYVPVCAYALDDLEVEQRVSSYLVSQQMDSAPYRRVLSAFANRPLHAGVGMQSWVAFRRYRGVPRLTVYLGSEVGRVFAPGTVPAGTIDHMSFDSVGSVFECLARYPLERHPFVRNVARLQEPGGLLWLLVSNASELLTNTNGVPCARFTAWLAAHSEGGHDLSVAELDCRHVLRDAVATARGMDAIGGSAGLVVAMQAARYLGGSVAALLEEEDSNTSVRSIDAALRHVSPSAVELNLIAQLEAAGDKALPAVVRGAMAMHEQLWGALDRIASVAEQIGKL